MSARDRILGRLRAVPSAPLPRPPEPPATQIDADADAVDSFTRHFTAAHGEVLDARGRDWRQAVRNVCREKCVARLLQPAGRPLLEPGADGPTLAAFDRPLEDFKAELFHEVDAGLTVADCAIAETGTLVLASSPAQPRTLSLVPPLHLCLLDATRLHPTLAAAMTTHGWAAAMPTNLIFISGPSKTADIQQTLAYGAHGPKEVVVILVSPGEPS